MRSRLRSLIESRYAALVVGLGFVALYLALLTQQYIGDGMRWYGAIAGLRPPELGGTNHLLYPLLGHVWFRAGLTLGAVPGYALAQSMNAVFGGLALGAYFAMVRHWTRSAGLAALAVLTLGFARAFSLHGVDMTEPMPGVAMAMVGLWLLARTAPAGYRRGTLLLAGACLGLAAALYQSNTLAVVGAMALVALVGPARTWPRRLWQAALVAAAAGLVAAGLYVVAMLTLGGAHDVGEAIRMSLVTESQLTGGAYAEVSLRRAAVLVFGLADALFGVRGLDGLSSDLFARGFTRPVGIAIALTALSVSVPLGLAVLSVFRRLSAFRTERQTPLLVGLGIGLLAQLSLAFYFGARYSKLWMLPLAFLIGGAAVAVAALRERPSTRGRLGLGLLLCGWTIPVVFTGLFANLIPDHNTPLACLGDAKAIVQRLAPGDLLISDWGGLPCEPQAPMKTLSIAGLAFEARLDSRATLQALDAAITQTERSGGRVYFYGLFDLSAADWQPFFEQRLKLPPTALDVYRARATVVLPMNAVTPEGRTLHLWQLSR